MKKCTQCDSEYDENNVNITYPLADRVCAECGTLLTEEELDALKNN
jgi:transcription initiation factor TFIIIB Brf1 subunit/transcription initiation factor TFIIB